jgi:hypothetical protein
MPDYHKDWQEAKRPHRIYEPTDPVSGGRTMVSEEPGFQGTYQEYLLEKILGIAEAFYGYTMEGHDGPPF